MPRWFKESIVYYPFPNRNRSLCKSIHLSVRLNQKQVKISNIPNFEIAAFGPRNENHLVICFPKKMEKKNGLWVNVLDSKSYAEFYDWYSRPALLDCAKISNNPLFESNIPFSFAICQAKSQCDGKYSFSGLNIPGNASRLYLESLRIRTQGTAYDDHFYVVYAKGLKLLLSPESAKQQLYTSPSIKFWLDLGREIPHQTYFDVACSYFANDDPGSPSCLFLTPESYIARKENGAHKAGEEDIMVLLDQLKGFRCETKERVRKQAHIVYAQLYSSEKVGVTSSLKQALVHSFSLNDVLTDSGKYRQASRIVRLCWPHMANSKYSLRYEVRISYEALVFLISLNFRPLLTFIAADDCVAIPSSHFSLYKLLLADCYGGIVEKVKSRNRFGMETGGSGYRSVALMTTLLKGLISRLDDSSWNRELFGELDIQSQMKMHKRFVLRPEDFDHCTGHLLLAQRIMKVCNL